MKSQDDIAWSGDSLILSKMYKIITKPIMKCIAWARPLCNAHAFGPEYRSTYTDKMAVQEPFSNPIAPPDKELTRYM